MDARIRWRTLEELVEIYELDEEELRAVNLCLASLSYYRRWRDKTPASVQKNNQTKRPITAEGIANIFGKTEKKRRGILAVTIIKARQNGMDLRTPEHKHKPLDPSRLP